MTDDTSSMLHSACLTLADNAVYVKSPNTSFSADHLCSVCVTVEPEVCNNY